MSKIRDKQLEIMSLIDQVLTAIAAAPDMNLNLDHIEVGVNPTAFLLDLLMKIVPRDKILEWLVQQLTVSLPWIELGIKGVLLAHLKATIDCANDPRIPYYLREWSQNDFDIKAISTSATETEKEDRGFHVGIESIDYKNILMQSPLDVNQTSYFGTSRYYTVVDENVKEDKRAKYTTFYDALLAANQDFKGIDDIERHGVETVHELCRAKDMNAFLWYVKNQTRHQLVTPISKTSSIFGNTLSLSPKIYENGKTKLPVGTIQQSGNTFYIFAKRQITYETTTSIPTQIPELIEKSHQDLILPYYSSIDTDLGRKITWYNRKSNIEDVWESTKSRSRGEDTLNDNVKDYKESMPMLIFEATQNGETNIQKYGSMGGFHVMIPRKPLALGPLYILFNENGENSGSRYEKRFTVIATSITNDALSWCQDFFGDVYNNIKDKVKKTDKKTEEATSHNEIKIGIINGELKISKKNGITINPSNGKNVKDCLFECYPNLTVYEYNYDYVMGLQLFEPKTMANSLLEIAYGVRPNASSNVSISRNETEYQMRIAFLVDKIMNQSENSTVSDCYFSFSNEEFEQLMRESEMKRANLYPFNDYDSRIEEVDPQEVLDMLNDYNEDGSLEENVQVLMKAFSSGVPSITDEVLPEDKYSLQGLILLKLIKGFLMAIIDAILSPKIMLLLEINKRLMMEDKLVRFNVKFLVQSIFGLIQAIIVEVLDMILKLILNLILDTLKDLFTKVGSLLLQEQLDRYTRILRQILEVCSFHVSHRKPLDAQLDDVSGAEITAVDKPISKEC